MSVGSVPRVVGGDGDGDLASLTFLFIAACRLASSSRSPTYASMSASPMAQTLPHAAATAACGRARSCAEGESHTHRQT